MADGPRGIMDLLRHPWARTVLEAAGIVLFFWLIGRLSEVFTPLLIGLVAAYTLDPVVTWLTRHGISRHVSVALVFGTGVIGLVAVLVWGLPRGWREVRVLYSETMIGDAYVDLNGDGRWEPGEPLTRDLNHDGVYQEAYYKRLHRLLISKGLMHAADVDAPAHDGAAEASVAASGSATPVAEIPDFDPVIWMKDRISGMVTAYNNGDHHAVDKGLTITRRVLFYLTALALIPIYAFFFSLNLPHVSHTILQHVPLKHHSRTLRIFAEINQAVGAFFRGRVLICAILAVLASAGFAFAHVPSWLVLGLLMGVASAIPMASILMLVPACFLLYLSSAEAWQYWVAVLTYVVVQGLEHVLLLIIMGAGVELHPVLIIVAILSFGALFGVPGVLLAVPLAATARILMREFLYPVLRQMAGLEPIIRSG